MILIDLPNTTVFRAHTPKYSFQPTSGAGAAHLFPKIIRSKSSSMPSPPSAREEVIQHSGHSYFVGMRQSYSSYQ